MLARQCEPLNMIVNTNTGFFENDTKVLETSEQVLHGRQGTRVVGRASSDVAKVQKSGNALDHVVRNIPNDCRKEDLSR